MVDRAVEAAVGDEPGETAQIACAGVLPLELTEEVEGVQTRARRPPEEGPGGELDGRGVAGGKGDDCPE